MRKRGVETSAGNIATLVALIALFIILYILLLPQEDREELLYGEDGKVRGFVGGEEVLFSEFLGELDPLKKSKEVTHRVVDVNLFTSSEADAVTLGEGLAISSGFLNDKSQNLVFGLEDVNVVEQTNLYLVLGEAKGNLIITLNDHEIFNNEVNTNTQRLINLPLEYLKEVNDIGLSVSKGLFGNKYEIKSAVLRKKLTSRVGDAVRVFSVPVSEMKDVSKAEFSYDIFCSSGEKNILSIFMNDKLTYSDVPFCNLEREKTEIDSSYLKSGNNEVRFSSKGEYVVSNIKIKTLLDEEKSLERHFGIEDEVYMDVKRGFKDVMLVFEFSISDDRKILDLYVNENLIEINTNEDTYYETISSYLKRDNNLIRLEPKNSFEVITFEIKVA